MLKKAAFFIIFLILSGQGVRAEFSYGFGVGYTAKNVYEDTLDCREEEKSIPLLGLTGGYRIRGGTVEFALDGHVDFFAMDILRGNREYILFADPQTFISVPLRMGAFAISPVLGYGGIHRIRYIERRTYLSGEERYVNAANFSQGIMDIIYGVEFLYGDWFSSSFIITGEMETLSTFSSQIRTPHCSRSAPFISFTYREGEDIRTFGIGLTFYR